MSAPALQHYLRHHRAYALSLWVVLFAANTVANIAVTIVDNARFDYGAAPWEVVTWEISSTLMMIVLLPLMLRFDDRFPLRLDTLPRNLIAHALFTLPWSLAHVAGMVLIRKAVYFAAGSRYEFGPVLAEFGYEFLKDVRSYATLLAVIYLYRFVLLRLQGEARFLSGAEDETPDSPAPDRFLVKKLGREFLVRVDDIDWIEAAGNYVNLHVGPRLYPLRETMTNIEQRLQGAGFARVHRSAIVNMDRIAEIEPFETGDARAHLRGGGQVPVSRRFRSALRAELG